MTNKIQVFGFQDFLTQERLAWVSSDPPFSAIPSLSFETSRKSGPKIRGAISKANGGFGGFARPLYTKGDCKAEGEI